METKHTKGPWIAEPINDASNGWINVRMSDFALITIYGESIDRENPNTDIIDKLEANAKLIAAAPDLLEACIKMAAACNKYNIEVLVPEYENMINSINKAIGNGNIT